MPNRTAVVASFLLFLSDPPSVCKTPLEFLRVVQFISPTQGSYVYDAFDNILSIPQTGAGTIPYPTSPATNRYLGGENEIRYDGAGNLLEAGVVGGGPQWEMQYDPLNMQRRFISNGEPISDYLYAYDANDHRLVAFNWHTGDLRYHFRDLGGRILRELRVSGSGGVETWNSWSHQKDYVYGPQGLLATVTRSGEPMFYHQDHLGTPRAITNVNGVLRGRYDYFPFGQEVPRANPLDDWNVKFTGHQRDPHGLADYMMARTYLWRLRRFASMDPGRDGWNLYAYALNNPIGRVDPDGRESRVAQMVDQGNREILAGGEAYFQDEGLQNAVSTAMVAVPGPEDVVIGAVAVGTRAVAAARGGGLLARAGNFVRKVLGKVDDVKVSHRRLYSKWSMATSMGSRAVSKPSKIREKVAMGKLWSNKIDEILSVGQCLRAEGIRNWALTRSQALAALEEFAAAEVAVLGGDVYESQGDKVFPNRDSWYCDQEVDEEPERFIIRSIEKARSYITQYQPNGEFGIYFVLVPEPKATVRKTGFEEV